MLGKFEDFDLSRQTLLREKLPLFNQRVGVIAGNCRQKVKSSLFPGWGCGFIVVVFNPLAKVSLMYVDFSVIQLLVKSLASNKSHQLS